MSVLARLDAWQRAGAITTAQRDTLAALTRRQRISVYLELNALLYLGVLALVGGIGWTVSAYAVQLGDVAILTALTIACASAVGYCYLHGLPYTNDAVEQPGLAFDYVLYLGCLLFAIDLGYLQSHFHPFGAAWDHSLLVAAAVFFALAYWFDNRFVLSLALSTLAGWFGLEVWAVIRSSPTSLRLAALAYGGLVAGAGVVLHRARIKPHFLETYLHLASHALFLALLSGVNSTAPSRSSTCSPCWRWRRSRSSRGFASSGLPSSSTA